MDVDIQLKEWFFDRECVIAAMEHTKRQAFWKAATYVRKRAMTSMRRQKKASPPGRPPAFHDTAAISLRTIWYGYDRARDAVVIGPIRSNSSKYKHVPRTHEFGEVAPVKEWRFVPLGEATEKRLKKSKKLANQFNRWMNLGDKAFPNMSAKTRLPADLQYRQDTRIRNVKYPKRPFMKPALLAERRKFPHLFKGKLRAKVKARKR